MVAPCANCKKQLREVCEDHGLDEVEVVGLHDLFMEALVFPGAPAAEAQGGAEAAGRAPEEAAAANTDSH